MKQKLLVILLLIFTIKTFSQDSKLSVEAHYPIPLGDNFIGESYKGVIDVGAKYRFSHLTFVNIGTSLNGGVLRNNTNVNNELINSNFRIMSYMVQPRIFAELDSPSIRKLHPFIGLGYTFMIFDASGTNNGVDVSALNETRSGINVNLGVAYDITEKLSIQVQYDFVRLRINGEVLDIAYNKNVAVLKIGLGYRL